MILSIASFCSSLWSWWLGLRADPQKCGLLVLLAWQIVPVLLLSRHSATVHLHYLLMILPGPFILIGYFVASIIAWLQKREPGRVWRDLRFVTYAVTVLILIGQLVGSTASLIDKANGINNHIFGYNDLGSLQHAISEADHVALKHHLSRVFISVSTADNLQVAPHFLAQQMHSPTTLFDSSGCLVLPNAGDGPAVYLLKSTDSIASVLLSRFATTILIDRPPLMGTAPFQLYIVSPKPLSTPPPTGKGFVGHLQLLDSQAQLLSGGSTPLLATRWTFLHSEPARAFTSYTYTMKANTGLTGMKGMRSDCMLTSIRAGDQLVTTFALPQVSGLLASISITSQFQTMSPNTFSQGPLHFETFNIRSATTPLQTEDGSGVITLADIALPT